MLGSGVFGPRWGSHLASDVRASAATVALVLACVPALARAQASATVSMSADRSQVEVGEPFRLTIRADVIGAQAPDVELPDLSAFDVLSRQMSRPIQFSFGFGASNHVIQSSVVYSFVLRARAPGRYELAPARLRIAGREFVSHPLTIVVGGTHAPAGPDKPDPVPQPTPAPPAAGGADVIDAMVHDDAAFLRTVVDRRAPWVGEQVTVTIYLYVRGALRAWPTVTREPTTDGFWVHDLLPPVRSTEPIQIAGAYRVYVLRRFAAFPLRPGELTIGAMSATIPIGDVFDVFLGQPPADLDRTGVSVTLRVRELPRDGRPPGEPHVGRLALDASLDRSQVPTGDAVTLTVRATGTGQIQALRIPMPPIDGLRVLAPQARDDVSASSDLVGGTKTMEWLIVPEREGTYTIPAFRVPVFDPASATWSVAHTEPLSLTAAGNPVGGVAAGGPAEPEPPLDDDDDDPDAAGGFGLVRTRSALSRGEQATAQAPWYPWAAAAPPLAWLGLLAGAAIRRRLALRAERDVRGRASREAKKRLASAEAAARSGDAHSFYGALSLALKSAIEGRLGESVGSLTHSQLRKRLLDRGMSEDLARRVVDELEGIEFARFSSAAAERAEMDGALRRARRLLGELDRFVAAPPEDG
jgi:hypothetical protein